MGIRSVAAACCCVALLAGCPGPGPNTGPTIHFGASIDRSANNAEPSWADTIKLAEAQMNAALKDQGIDLRFEFTIRDSANDPTTSVANATDMVTSLGAKGMILDTSQNDQAVNKTFYDADPGNDLGVPLICGGCTSGSINSPTNADPDPVLREANHNTLLWNFRAIMSTKLLSKVIATIAARTNSADFNGDGKVKIGFYGSNEAFGKGARADIDAAFRAVLGCPVAPNPCANYVIDDLFHPQDADANSYAWANDVAQVFSNVNTNTQLPDGYPDVVVAAHFAQQDAAFTRAYRTAGSALIPDPAKIKVMHFQTFRLQSVLKATQDVANGEEGVSHITLDGESGQLLKTDYEAAFGAHVVYRDAIYYDAAVALMLGALIGSQPLTDKTTVTGAQVAAGMRKTSDVANAGAVVRPGVAGFADAIAHIKAGEAINYEGASGPMDFDAVQNILDRLVHYQVNGGTFSDVETFDCVSSSTCPLVGQ